MLTPKLAIVIPCFNEEEVISKTINELEKVVLSLINTFKISSDSYLFLVDDGSKDKTWEIINECSKTSKIQVKGVKFTRNFGNQSAILAGYDEVRKLGADMTLTIDADLQQDITKIPEFVESYKQGYDIVAGVKNNRKTDGIIKSLLSEFFYVFINWMGVKLKPNHSEYRLISKRTLDIISHFKEKNIFLRGLFSELGLKTKYIHFDVKEREYGQSKFSLISLFRLALNGIFSYSTYPLRLVFIVGIVISLGSFTVAFLIFLEELFNVNLFYDIEFFKVWTSFIEGIQILCIGIIGEYIGQILLEVKGRPCYLIAQELNIN